MTFERARVRQDSCDELVRVAHSAHSAELVRE